MTVATIEPISVRAGDTWVWRREDLTADYPASVWTLTYRFKNSAGGFAVVAAADGDYFEATVAAATSASIAAGDYAWQARVTAGAVSHTVGTGVSSVLANLFATSATVASDQRSQARKVLEAIDAVILGRASKDQEEYAIGNRSLKRTPLAELQALRDRYAARVRAEEAVDRLAQGRPARNKLFVRL
jgi:hypothetical protein